MGKLEDAERVPVTSAASWRSWLTDNADTSTGVWVVVDRRDELYNDLVEEALCFGWIDGVAGTDAGESRLWFAPRSPRSAWASSNRERVTRLQAEGRLAPRGLRVIEEAQASGMWSVLIDAEAGIEPAALTAALDATPEARATWETYPPSVRKQALSGIALARTPATIARRIAVIVDAAAEGRRPS